MLQEDAQLLWEGQASVMAEEDQDDLSCHQKSHCLLGYLLIDCFQAQVGYDEVRLAFQDHWV